MTQEINIDSFLQNISKKRKTLLLIMIASIAVSVIYSFTATEYYKVSAYVLPPESRHIQPLNVVDVDGDLISKDGEAIKPVDVYNNFIMNIQSRKLQREYFFSNSINQFYDDSDLERSFEKNFHKNLLFELSAKTTSRDIRSQSFLTISFISTDPNRAADILNNYIKMANKKTTESIVDSVNKLILNTRSSIIAEIDGRRNLARKVTQDRIKRLEEAYLIADQLGITERQSDVNNSQNVILSDTKSLSTQSPLYLFGTKSLMAEIDILKQRKSFDPFIPGLRSLEQKAEGLNNLSVNISDVNSAQIDQSATKPKSRFAPKRKLIVLIGTFLGLLICFLYLISESFIRRTTSY